jgi:predicted permease
MSPITQALIPILALILAGFVIQRSNFLPATFWPSAEKLTYFLLMPAILIHSIANKQMADLPWFGMLVTVEGAVIVSAVLIISWWRFNRHIDGPGFTSAFQGAVRFNSFVALALAEKLFGAEGLFLAALGAGFMILLINVLCVSAFSVAVNEGRSIRPAAVLADLARNPLIIACVIGVSLNVSGLKLPQEIDGVLVLAGKAAFPIGLMAVGRHIVRVAW